MASEIEHQEVSKEQPAEVAEAAEIIGGGLKQIQKILVEPRALELQAAVDALDQRRIKDLADLRKELDRSIHRSDAFLKKESSVLSERLSTERRERARAIDDRARELEAQVRQLAERVEKLEEQLGTETRDLRQLILDQHREYSEELRGWRDDMARAIAHELGGLRSEKADRSVLAQLLSEVGERLSGQAGGSLPH